MYRAIYKGTCDIPRYGSIGKAWKSEGFYDPDSAAYEAWLFEPEEQEEGEDSVMYYVSSDDLDFLPDFTLVRPQNPQEGV